MMQTVRIQKEIYEMTGKVKWFSPQKGYGFIAADGSDKEYFVHYSSIKGDGYKTLKDDASVSFEVGKSPDGREHAIDVAVL